MVTATAMTSTQSPNMAKHYPKINSYAEDLFLSVWLFLILPERSQVQMICSLKK